MTDATTLEALAVRVEAGETGREIDGAIAVAMGWTDHREYVPMGHGWQNWYKDEHGKTQFELPKWSTSLDAVAALAERVAQDWHLSLEVPRPRSQQPVRATMNNQMDGDVAFGAAPTECAARLAAILRAKAKDTQ